jgi:hypothetical protein
MADVSIPNPAKSDLAVFIVPPLAQDPVAATDAAGSLDSV